MGVTGAATSTSIAAMRSSLSASDGSRGVGPCSQATGLMSEGRPDWTRIVALAPFCHSHTSCDDEPALR
jgi:hypothetical protein